MPSWLSIGHSIRSIRSRNHQQTQRIVRALRLELLYICCPCTSPKCANIRIAHSILDDESNTLTFAAPDAPQVPAKTTWTLLLYLTSPVTGCIGGETVFYPEPKKTNAKNEPAPEPVVVELEVGMALLHRHGADCMLHEGREVREGEKWVIRSDLCVRR